MRINWKEVCKFLSGAFFVSAGILFYLWLTNTPMPVWGTSWVVSPEAHGWRAIAHVVFLRDLLLFRLRPEVTCLAAIVAAEQQSEESKRSLVAPLLRVTSGRARFQCTLRMRAPGLVGDAACASCCA